MLRWSVLAVAVVLNLPVAYATLVEQTTSVDTLLVRLLITVPIVAVLLAAVRIATRTPSDS